MLLLRLEGSRLGRLVRNGSGRNMLELWGSRRKVLVFKGSRRNVLETSGSRRMVLEWGLMLLFTSGWGLTLGADGEGSWIRLGSTVKRLTGLTWLLFLPLPDESQRDGHTGILVNFHKNIWIRIYDNCWCYLWPSAPKNWTRFHTCCLLCKWTLLNLPERLQQWPKCIFPLEEMIKKRDTHIIRLVLCDCFIFISKLESVLLQWEKKDDLCFLFITGAESLSAAEAGWNDLPWWFDTGWETALYGSESGKTSSGLCTEEQKPPPMTINTSAQ